MPMRKSSFFVWGKLFQSAQEFLKALAIDVKEEHTGIRILGKVPNTSLVSTLTDIYSYMILSQALTSFASILFFQLWEGPAMPPYTHRIRGLQILEPPYYLSEVIKREHPFSLQGYPCPQFKNRGLPNAL
jgi:hypothetical protein